MFYKNFTIEFYTITEGNVDLYLAKFKSHNPTYEGNRKKGAVKFLDDETVLYRILEIYFNVVFTKIDCMQVEDTSRQRSSS